MIRFALTVTVFLAGITTILTHHHKHPVPVALSAAPSDRADLPRIKHVSRGRSRLPLRVKPAPVWTPPGGSHLLHDITMYCSTGNRNAAGRWPQLGDVAVMDRSIPFGTRLEIGGNAYTVEDWIGWGSDYDIFGGNDPGCEQRALNFGRQHLPVVVER